MITVANIRTTKDGVYIGRAMPARSGSPLGNPFKLERGCDRELAVYQYREWLEVQACINDDVIHELERLTELARAGDLVLLCWCAPLGCHGDVVKAAIEQRLSES